MADVKTCAPLTRASVQEAHERIKSHVHRTPVRTCKTIDQIASTPVSARCPGLGGANTLSEPAPHDHHGPHNPDGLSEDTVTGSAKPKVRLFFKCENQQRIGAFKARGAFHALGKLIEEEGLEEVRRKGVITHSSGNHAQALALAAKTYDIPAHIVMPKISTPSKISGTMSHGANVIFSGSTSDEREAVVAEVMAKTGATLVPPYDHPDIILGQGTQALELEQQVSDLLALDPEASVGRGKKGLDAVIAPCGGGGMLSGICTALDGTGIRVFGAEPHFEGANDAERGLKQGKRIEKVSTLTIADGVRTPVGEIPWRVISDPRKLGGMYSVSEEEIKGALRLAMERAKFFVEPTAVVGLAVILYNEDFRKLVEKEGGQDGWNIGVILSGGNTTVDAISKLFASSSGTSGERAESKIGVDGEKKAENIAG